MTSQSQADVGSENLFVASTYADILSDVASIPMAKASVQMSSVATRISMPDPVCLESLSQVTYHMINSQSSSEEIQTSPIQTDVFDEVVCTFPLGYLKRRHTTLFHPPLPPSILKAISAISYGNLEKIYLTFPTAFWTQPSLSPDATDIGFTHFLHPPATTLNPTSANIELLSLASLPGDTAQPTLLFYLYPPLSMSLTSTLAATPATDHHEYLSTFLEPYYSLLPHYIRDSPDCTPSASFATSWSTDEYAGYGSYTNFQTVSAGQVVQANGDQSATSVGLDRHIECLRHGLPERRLWFAGEATAPFVGLGTVTGAYWSGEKVAERILEAYSMTRN